MVVSKEAIMQFERVFHTVRSDPRRLVSCLAGGLGSVRGGLEVRVVTSLDELLQAFGFLTRLAQGVIDRVTRSTEVQCDLADVKLKSYGSQSSSISR